MAERENKTLFDLSGRKPEQLVRDFEKSFDQPLAHRADSLSSYEAGERALKSGKLKGQVQTVYSALCRYPNTTSKELAVKADLDRHMVARRLSVLVNRGLAERGPYRKCSIGKSKCRTWRPIYG